MRKPEARLDQWTNMGYWAPTNAHLSIPGRCNAYLEIEVAPAGEKDPENSNVTPMLHGGRRLAAIVGQVVTAFQRHVAGFGA